MSTNLKSFAEIIGAGKASIDKNEVDEFLVSFNSILEQLCDNGNIEDKIIQDELESIFNQIVPSKFASELADKLEPDTYFKFGILLQNSGYNISPSIIHGYLNLFRFSSFLIKIYDDDRWCSLIYSLIEKSRFTVNKLIEQRARDYSSKNIFTVLRGDSEINYKWENVERAIVKHRNSIWQLLVNENAENSKVGFLLSNSLEMVLLDLACLSGGIENIMIPANSVPQHISYILNQTESVLLFVTDEKQLSKIKALRPELPKLKKVVMIEGNSAEHWVISLSEFLNTEIIDEDIDKLKTKIENISIDDLATIMYTSGTTGEPKGIMFSQGNIVYKRFCRAAALPEISDEDKFIAYLPLFHTFGRYLEMMGAIFWGAEYVFMENPSVDVMLSNMQKVKPSIFISIPKKWIQLYEEIIKRVDIELAEESEIVDTIKALTGGRLRWGLSAAGYLPPEVFQFFQKYGVELMSGFGMTEATGGITMTPPGKYIPNSLGKALPGIEIKLAPDGELLIKGNYVMIGYFNTPKEETFDDEGWFATGDIMKTDENNFIEIIDRKKEIYKNVKGETIAPQKIENLFRDFDDIKQVFLVGDHRLFNTVLIYPDYESESLKLAEMSEGQKNEYFSSVIVTVNKFLAPFERIVDYRIIDRPFNAEQGELTPKGTYKRRVIEKNFDDLIESMYKKSYSDFRIADVEIRIPNWFLREKGCLNRDIVQMPESITIPKLHLELKIKRCGENGKLIQIGDFCYGFKSRYIDLQPFFTNPYYWAGNESLFNFCGDSIFQWYRRDEPEDDIEFYSKFKEPKLHEKTSIKIRELFSAGEQSLYGIHLAATLLQSGSAEEANLGIQYLAVTLKDESLPTFKLAIQILSRPNLTDTLTARRNMFLTALEKQNGNEFGALLSTYLKYDFDLLDDHLVNEIIDRRIENSDLNAIRKVLENEINILEDKNEFHNSSIPFLFNLLAGYGIQHPTKYESIRQTFVGYQLNRSFNELSVSAQESRTKMRTGFRKWLGANQKVAVDMETGEEYRWKDVIIAEPDTEPDERERIIKAISETSIIREAIFLFSRGKLIRLDNILPGGIWVSKLRNYHDKSVYRVSVQTRLQGAFDIVLNLHKDIPKENVSEEINWLILAGSRFYLKELVEDFGGYWEKFGMWSSKFVPGDTVGKFLQRETRKKDESIQKRLYYLWPFFVWNTAAAYFNFWKLTGHKLELAEPTSENFIVPPHDYQTGTRVVSFSERKHYTDVLELFKNYHINFILNTEEIYPFLKREKICKYVFSGLINTEGEIEGVRILRELEKELDQCNDLVEFEEVSNTLKDFLRSIELFGFIPKQLYFAIKRYHRWTQLNEGAALNAEAEMLNELFDTYNLTELEINYPEVRSRFFLETVFIDSSDDLIAVLREVVHKQHSRQLTKDQVVEYYSNILSEFSLNEKEDYFLTRLTYPHLKPSDSAAVMKIRTEGSPSINLVVEYEDYDGIPFTIRKPVSPKEISRLYQLFIDANLLVNFRPEHNFLVAISERGFIIGGLFFNYVDDKTVYMDKIVVSNRYRKKGISDRLMNELFNRLKSEKVNFVTTGFFRPEYFYRFGFKIERKYSGLVKDLSKPG